MINLPKIKAIITRTITEHNTLFSIAGSGDLSKYSINWGYKPDTQDKTRFCFSNSPMNAATPQDEISLKQYFKPVSNQYNLSACVANATADALEATIVRHKGLKPEDVADLSRLFIYYNARNNESPPATDTDAGTMIWLAIDSITRYGVPPESTWDYITSNVNLRPSAAAYVNAIKNRFTNYYSINSTGDDRITDIIKVLSSGCPVIFGTKVDKSYLDTTDNIVMPPSENYIGGHAEIITGYSASKRAFEIRNSWGESWGLAGYCWMDPSYLTADITQDIWAATI